MIQLTDKWHATRGQRMLKRWSAGYPVVLIALTLLSLGMLFATPAGAFVVRVLPYLVVPGIGFALIAAERRLRAPLPMLSMLAICVIADAAITRYPLVRPLQISVPLFALFALLLVAVALCFSADARLRRSAPAIMACIVVLSLVWTPASVHIRSLNNAWQST